MRWLGRCARRWYEQGDWAQAGRRRTNNEGRTSLFVYWIHVEMVYGFLSRPLRRSLTIEQALTAYVLFTVFLLSLVRMKSWLVQARAIYLTDSKSVI